MFHDLGGMFESEFGRASYTQAVSDAKDQSRSWINTLEFVKKSAESSNSRDFNTVYLEKILQLISDKRENIFFVTEREGEYFVSGQLPVIVRDSTKIATFLNNNPAKGQGVIFAETADYFYRNVGTLEIDVPSQILMYAAAYLAEKGMPVVHSLVETQDNIDKIKNDVKSLIFEVEARSKTVADEFILKYQDILDTASKDLSVIESDRSVRSEAWEEFLRNSNKEIDAAKRLAFESEALKSARDVWSNKLNRHRFGYWIGLCVLTVSIFVLIISFFKNSDLIYENMLKLRKSDGDLPYILIIPYIIPVVAIAWILRIFNGFVASSRVLSEDAEQRQAMLDTYFRLVGDPSAKMEPTDRVLILNAIFRPLPGQQMEDVSPPSILDLAQSAMPKK